MSNCKEVFALLSQYLDRELPEGMCDEMERHIAGCSPCVEFVESLRRTIRLCHEFEAADRPGPLPESTQQQLLEAYRKMMAARGGSAPA